MPRVLAFLALLVLNAQAAPPFTANVNKWVQVPVPAKTNGVAYQLWFYAGNYSPLEWRVFLKNGLPHARLISDTTRISAEHPGFTPRAGEFAGASAFARVSDGWLVGFNKGEGGAALYWFSADGKRNYKISEHQVWEFFHFPDGVYAVEGLAHLTMNEGSLIRVTHTGPQSRTKSFASQRRRRLPR